METSTEQNEWSTEEGDITTERITTSALETNTLIASSGLKELQTADRVTNSDIEADSIIASSGLSDISGELRGQYQHCNSVSLEFTLIQLIK